MDLSIFQSLDEFGNEFSLRQLLHVNQQPGCGMQGVYQATVIKTTTTM